MENSAIPHITITDFGSHRRGVTRPHLASLLPHRLRKITKIADRLMMSITSP